MVLMMMMTMVLANMAKSELHYVGGDKSSWGPNVNLTEWSSHEHFHLEDWLCKISSLFFFFSFLNVSFSLVQSKWLEWLIMEWSDKNITFIQVYMYKNLNHYTTLKFLNFNTLQ